MHEVTGHTRVDLGYPNKISTVILYRNKRQLIVE